MCKQQHACADRVLIASANADDRRLIGEQVRAAELRAVGFIRAADEVYTRTRLSMPNVLLLDVELLDRMQEPGPQFEILRQAGPLKIVLFGRRLKVTAQQKKIMDETLDLADVTVSEAGGLAHVLRKLLREKSPEAPKPVQIPIPPSMPAGVKRKTLQPHSVVIGSSTGGPVALMTVLKGLPNNFPLPVAVVQHMPPGFTRMLAERLNHECALRVVEAQKGMAFEAGTVYIAPGGFHMVLDGNPKSPRVELNTQDPENSCRPAVDVLFRSSAKVYGGHQHAIVLTGMGRDGLLGATQLHGLGSRIVVQDAATSTVWGMPGAIAQAGYADDILPVDQIAPQLLRCL